MSARVMVEFGHSRTVWQVHYYRDTDRECAGRILRLAYPWKWDTHYCMQDCCKTTDKEAIYLAGYNPSDVGFIRHIAATTVNFDFLDLWWCMDCGATGTRAEKDLPNYQPAQRFPKEAFA